MMAEQQQAAPQFDYFAQKRIELMIEVANKAVLSEVNMVKQTMVQLERELIDLRKRIHDTQAAQVHVQAAPQSVVTETQRVVAAAPQTFAPERKVSADVPRYGHYTSNDVSIEKFFNFSGKKR
jgi:hypothetical protein